MLLLFLNLVVATYAQQPKNIFYLAAGAEGGYSFNHQLWGAGLVPTLGYSFNRLSLEYSIGQISFQGNPSNFNYIDTNVMITQTWYTGFKGNRVTVSNKLFGEGDISGWTAPASVDHSTVLINRLRLTYKVIQKDRLSLLLVFGESYHNYRDLTIGKALGFHQLTSGGNYLVELTIPVDLAYHTWQTEVGFRGQYKYSERVGLTLTTTYSTNFRWSKQMLGNISLNVNF